MTVEYLDLTDYVAIAADVTGLDVTLLIKASRLDLADSALHAPSAGIGDEDFYPDFVDKAAVLIVRLVKNDPLLDGNKRAGWVSLRAFIDLNGWGWAEKPAIDEAENLVVGIAAGEQDEDSVADWLRPRMVAHSDPGE